MRMGTILRTCAGATALAFAFGAPVQALTVNVSAGSEFDVLWTANSVAGSSDPVDLRTTSHWNVTTFNSTTLEIEISFNNTTSFANAVNTAAGLSSARFTSAGFTVNNLSITGAAVDPDTGALGGVALNTTLSGASLEVCLFSGPNCNGGGSGGLDGGDMKTLTLTLTGNFGSATTAELDIFRAKFQTNLGSTEPYGRTPPGGVNPIPIPAALPLMAAGLFALGALARRRKRGLVSQPA